VGNGDVVAVDWVDSGGDVAGCGVGFEVGDDLVAEEVEVDPSVGTAAFGTVQDGGVEVPGGREVVDGEGDVEGAEGHGGSMIEDWLRKE
jgi:hypothetical protein